MQEVDVSVTPGTNPIDLSTEKEMKNPRALAAFFSQL